MRIADPNLPLDVIAERVAAEFSGTGLSERGREYLATFKQSVRAMAETTRSYQRDKAQLTKRRDTMLPEGYERLQRELRAKAQSDRSSAQTVAQQALRRIEAELERQALPQVSPGREELARGELQVALSGGDPSLRAIDIASNGSREVAATLLTSFGTELLKSRGVQNPDRVQREARRAAISSTLQTSTDASEIVAAKTLATLPRLAAASTAAFDSLGTVLAAEDRAQAQLADLRDRELEARHGS
jgi:hypothetical protein